MHFVQLRVLTVIFYNLQCKPNAVVVVELQPCWLAVVSVWQELPVSDGIELLQLVLNFEIKDPLVLSCVLTNVSALFPFVTYKPAFLPQVFSKV
jgi:hypothetical protein